MILTDYFRSEHDLTWDLAKQCGITHGVIRLPDNDDFDVTNKKHWDEIYKRFTDFGIKPIVIEPLPNNLHDHIKSGDQKRDEAIEKVIKMLAIMDSLNIRIICFYFMAHIGWLRTDDKIKERGNALVTGFDLNHFTPIQAKITAEELWDNYTYFIKTVIPYAEKHNIKLALHPDDPPIERLGDVERIMISYENIKKAIYTFSSPNLGITMCQATYHMMGENIYQIIPEMKEKIFFIHFRNASGNKFCFRETFHDNGEIDMKKVINLYKTCAPNVPIRVDHVPLMAGETSSSTGYTALGRLFAIGYLKGLMQ